ncbi:hypothetical protein [Streptomyces sp. MMG1533]|nr:hypothetical protein [Streptomyces sp. MMG1533]
MARAFASGSGQEEFGQFRQVSVAPATVMGAWNIQWTEPGLFSCR